MLRWSPGRAGHGGCGLGLMAFYMELLAQWQWQLPSPCPPVFAPAFATMLVFVFGIGATRLRESRTPGRHTARHGPTSKASASFRCPERR